MDPVPIITEILPRAPGPVQETERAWRPATGQKKGPTAFAIGPVSVRRESTNLSSWGHRAQRRPVHPRCSVAVSRAGSSHSGNRLVSVLGACASQFMVEVFSVSRTALGGWFPFAAQAAMLLTAILITARFTPTLAHRRKRCETVKQSADPQATAVYDGDIVRARPSAQAVVQPTPTPAMHNQREDETRR